MSGEEYKPTDGMNISARPEDAYCSDIALMRAVRKARRRTASGALSNKYSQEREHVARLGAGSR